MSHAPRDGKPFETDILNIACLIGLGRMLVAVYNDFGEEYVSPDTLLDSILLVIFSIPLILSRTKAPFYLKVIPFLLALIIAMSVNWLSTGGLNGTGEYHFMMLFILVAMILRGWLMVSFLSLLVIVEVSLIYMDTYNSSWLNSLREGMEIGSMGGMHFLIMVVVVMFAMVYLKDRFERERLTLKKKGRNLKSKLLQIDEQNRVLMQQKRELEEVRDLLEQKVKERTAQLDDRNKALEEYWQLSLSEINHPLKVTVRSINDIKVGSEKSNELIDMLAESGEELLHSIKDVVRELERESKLAAVDDQR